MKKLNKQEYDRQRYLENKDKIKEQNSRYQKEHPEVNRRKALKWYNKNKEEASNKANIRNKKRYKEFPWLRVGVNARQRCNNTKNPRYKYYGGKGVAYLLSNEELKELWFRDQAWELSIPSIDRKENDGNYEFNNCHFIELSENTIKSNIKRT